MAESNILKDTNNRYHWIYELPMKKSFFLLFEVWKVLCIGALIFFIINILISLILKEGSQNILEMFGVSLLCLGIMLVLSIPAYYIVIKANNGMYTVLFEMDDNGIDHIQIKTDKANALDLLTVFVGVAGKNRTTTAAGLLSSTGSSLYSRFVDVRKIKAYKAKNLIILKSRFINNQVYVNDEDFDFVYEFITERCENATAESY